MNVCTANNTWIKHVVELSNILEHIAWIYDTRPTYDTARYFWSAPYRLKTKPYVVLHLDKLRSFCRQHAMTGYQELRHPIASSSDKSQERSTECTQTWQECGTSQLVGLLESVHVQCLRTKELYPQVHWL